VLNAACEDAVALGVTVLAAAGDTGSADSDTDGRSHCDFPSSSPYVLYCGGTRLTIDSAGGIGQEVVWDDSSASSATGGGVSDVYPVPAWQTSAGVPDNADSGKPGRGVPDVAGNADPASGYQVLIDGTSTVFGGTSAVAPLWAALVARLAQQAGKRLGLLQTVLYDGVKPGVPQAGFRDVTSGGNGAYTAGPGWDACTGLGSPDGSVLPGVFAAGSAAIVMPSQQQGPDEVPATGAAV
jgi:kumamolisin